jgi:hypothetical protein
MVLLSTVAQHNRTTTIQHFLAGHPPSLSVRTETSMEDVRHIHDRYLMNIRGVYVEDET